MLDIAEPGAPMTWQSPSGSTIAIPDRPFVQKLNRCLQEIKKQSSGPNFDKVGREGRPMASSFLLLFRWLKLEYVMSVFLPAIRLQTV